MRTHLLRTISLATVVLLTATQAALAASPPTIAIKAPSAVAPNSVTLHGSINPNGYATTYDFSYGPTTALGTTSAAQTLGAGTKAVSVSVPIKDLEPGTVYYYELQATSHAGTSTTTVHTFKTGGAPPPGATTGGHSTLTTSSATVTGIVYPNNAPTTYYFEYGLTTAYGSETPLVTVPAGTAPLSVSANLTGLASGSTFHYQLVAVHTDATPFGGGDESFETYPDPRPKTTLQASTTPRSESGGPFTFTTTGTITYSSATPQTVACTASNATVAFYYGRKRLSFEKVTVSSNCTFGATTTIKHKPGKKGAREKLTVKIGYQGSGYVGSSMAKNETVTVG